MAYWLKLPLIFSSLKSWYQPSGSRPSQKTFLNNSLREQHLRTHFPGSHLRVFLKHTQARRLSNLESATVMKTSGWDGTESPPARDHSMCFRSQCTACSWRGSHHPTKGTQNSTKPTWASLSARSCAISAPTPHLLPEAKRQCADSQ